MIGIMPASCRRAKISAGVFEDQHIRELHQHVGAAVDGVLSWISDGVLDIVVAQMEVAAAMDLDRAAQGLGNLFHAP